MVKTLLDIEIATRITQLMRKQDRIFRECYDYSNVLDLSAKSVTIAYLGDKNMERAVKSYINCIHKVKFTECKFITNLVDDPHLDILRRHGVECIKVRPFKSVSEYDKFIVYDLYKYVNTDFLLIIQEDSTILWQSSWTDEFLNYDYIGAPWAKSLMINMGGHIVGKDTYKYFPKYSVGNLGFCLVSKKMLELLRTIPNMDTDIYKVSKFLDLYICTDKKAVEYLEQNGIKYAPRELASRFSYEWDVELVNDWFGIHCTKYDWINKYLDRVPDKICELCY